MNNSLVNETTTRENTTATTKREVNDRVFTQLGLDNFFIDNAHTPGLPHMRTSDLNAPLVLHVDDDEDLVDAVTARFRASGFRVACALDGETGMRVALARPADAIVLDYDMPNGRGDAIIKLLKNNKNTMHIPIVVLTAVHKKGLKRELLSVGADVFMTKPFEFEDLKSTVSSLIDTGR